MLKRLLITGAAGGIGKVARSSLRHLAHTIRLSDIAIMQPASDGEEVIPADLGDAASVDHIVEDCDAILHLGGIATEDSFAKILHANIIGIHNLYESAHRFGKPRIILASSNHAIGFYRQCETIGADAPVRPDGYYGVSKCFAESVARMYHDKFGQQTAIVRIGSCFPEPADHRMLSTWLSYGDFMSLVECVFTVPHLGCPIIYGVSNNETVWWDNSASAFLGWSPKDSSARFRDSITDPVPEPDSAAATYHGGKFIDFPIILD